MTGTKKGPHFGGANGNTKLVRTIANAARRARLDYEGFRRVSALVRKELGLRRPPRSRWLLSNEGQFYEKYTVGRTSIRRTTGWNGDPQAKK